MINALYYIIIALSLFFGGIWGWVNYGVGLKLAASVVVSVFFGTCIVAALFTYSYFFHEETDKGKIDRLQQQIKQAKKENKTK